jgi:hypothetical protein
MSGMSSPTSSTAVLAVAGSAAALIAGFHYLASSYSNFNLSEKWDETSSSDDDDDDDVDITAEVICEVYSHLLFEMETIYYDLVVQVQTNLPEWQQRIYTNGEKENHPVHSHDMTLTPQQITDAVRVELFQRVGTTDQRIHQILLLDEYSSIPDAQSFHDTVQDYLSVGNPAVHQAVTSIRTFWETTRTNRHWNVMRLPPKAVPTSSTTVVNTKQSIDRQ